MLHLEQLRDFLYEYLESPDNPDINFDVALEYEKLGQSASAITFFLRAAEFGYDSAPNLVYVSLLKVGLLLESLSNRNFSVSNTFLHAIAYQPNRPEAHFLLSRNYERNKIWQESYTFAVTGQLYVKHRAEPTMANIEYEGEYCLLFQQAVAGWWIGRRDESREIFERLLRTYSMTDTYTLACKQNLKLWGE